jgi:hypothetical protein
MTQSHKCAFLDGDECRADDHCQYKLTTACYPLGPKFCGKDQILGVGKSLSAPEWLKVGGIERGTQ